MNFAYATMTKDNKTIKLFMQPNFFENSWLLVDEDENQILEGQTKEELIQLFTELFESREIRIFEKEEITSEKQ